MIVLAGSANEALAQAIAATLGTTLAPRVLERFPDGELHVEIQASVRGQRVYVVQPTQPPVETHLFELLLVGDACRRAGAGRVTAVIPYFGYARQDRRAAGRDPIAARVAADVIGTAGFDAVVAVDLHSRATEGFFPVPLEHLSAVSLLAEAMRPWTQADSVIVAPDLGAAKLADRFGRILGVPVATVHKQRLSGREVTVRQLVGEVDGKTPLIVDDMLSTGGTVVAAARALLDAGARPDITVAVTHGLFSPPALDVLRHVPVTRILTTDSVPPPTYGGLPVQVVSLAPLLAEAIRRHAQDESLADLLSHE